MTGRPRVWALLAHAALTQLITFVLRPAMSYRALELEVPASWLGLLSGTFALVPLVLALPAGHVVDRIGERRVMVAGSLLMCAAGAVLLSLGGSVPGLLAGSVVLGTAHLGAVVAQQALVANTSGSGRMDTAFGYYTFAASLGQAAGPGLIVLFGGSQAIPDTTPIFQGATAIAVVLFALSFAVGSGGAPRRPETAERVGVRTLLRLPGLGRALFTSCVVLAAVDISLVYLPALGAERDIASGLIGALLVLRAAASMVSRLFLGRLAARLGRRRLLVLSVLMSAAGLAVAAAPVPAWLLATAVTAAGFGLGVGQPLTMSWLAESAPTGTRGLAMSLRLTGNRAGQVVVPGAVGLVAAGLGAAGVLFVTAVGLAWTGFLARKLSVDRPPQD
ncbi:putative MFS family arabinose efflux permease [Saccharopolyspora erythraea NRRL 2338]|uniref:Major facilitator superfamily MFS_1 n=2 Tax=Saccharopolyspora erythraea TaxID=1836 RepID=A4FHT4_SACEN|nr:MFS transporter [Saccharopolyspora erythraea]EQD81651.1 major facilitator transporter [Saccharopolyspora erythraea D]PFG97295.1 putative MFS family arabinose efflux permease [Saccharopolyspora erythraea NRRL 2338]QRK87487.1 MFS transporter [Saccharopolyspora erythraea]CAM03609.1 major facilitator superfamily MFS_1 [Saccharopolyspora erythraea NRRL 2338]